MVHIFTRNLTFQSNNLGKETTLVLAFNGYMEGLYEDFFPVVWKATKFGKSGPYRAQATYTSQLAFSRPWVVNGNIIDASTCVKINVSEKTSLTEANDVYSFSVSQAFNDVILDRRRTSRVEPCGGGVNGVLQAANNTGTVQDFAIGFMNGRDLMPTPALYFTDVGDGSHVTAEFTPILRAYITSDYQETAILRGAIDTPAIWEQDLAALSDSTTWNLTRGPSTSRYTIEKASR